MRLRYHIIFNILFNILSILLITYSFFVSYFIFSVISDQEFRFGLFSVWFEAHLTESTSIQSSTSYSSLQTSCTHLESNAIQQACIRVSSFQASGFVFFGISLMAIACILNSLVGSCVLLFKKEIPVLKITNYIGVCLYLLGILSYFALSMGSFTGNSDFREDTGVSVVFSAGILMLATSIHYLFLSKSLSDSQDSQEDLGMNPENRIDNSTTPVKPFISFKPYHDTGNSEDDSMLNPNQKARRVMITRGVQYEEDLSLIISASASSEFRMNPKKGSQELFLKSSLGKSALSPFSSGEMMEAHNNQEVQTCKQIIENLQEILLETEIKYDELQRNFEVMRINLDSALEVKDNLVRVNESKDKTIDNLRKDVDIARITGHSRSISDTSERDSKREAFASFDRYTDSTNLGSELRQVDRDYFSITLYKENQELKEENNKLKEKLETQKTHSKQASESRISATSEIDQQVILWEKEKNDLYYQRTQLNSEISHLKARMRSQEIAMAQEISEISAHTDVILNENSQLKQQLSSLLSQVPAGISNNSQLIDPQAEISSLQVAIASKDQEISELSAECHRFEVAYYNLKYRSKASISEESSKSMFSENSSHSSRSVQDLLIIESLSDVNSKSNSLLHLLNLKREAPMVYSIVWKTLEAIMKEKAQVDRLELALGRSPRNLAEFTVDFFTLHFGLRSLAEKQTRAMLQSLEELQKIGHPYGVFFCRLLGIFNPRPLSSTLSVFLVRIQEMFAAVAASRETPTFAENYEIAQYGGEASIIDVMDIVMKICRNQREIAERIVFSLHKDSESKLEIGLLKVFGTMAKTGRDAQHFFEVLDINHGGSVDYQEFVDGVRYTLNILVTQEEAEDLCEYIDDGAKGAINVEEWVRKTRFKEYLRKAYQKEAMVTKLQVLNAFVEEFELEMLEDYTRLRGIVKGKAMDKARFIECVKMIDKNMKEAEVVRMFEEIRQSEKSNVVSTEAFCISALKRKIGGYGVGIFGKVYLDTSVLKI